MELPHTSVLVGVLPSYHTVLHIWRARSTSLGRRMCGWVACMLAASLLMLASHAQAQVLATPVPGSLNGASVSQVSSGNQHTCAVTSAGAVQCWGNSGNGRTTVPAALATVSVASVSAGGNHTCAVTNAGAVQCWGFNGVGQTDVPAELATGGVASVNRR